MTQTRDHVISVVLSDEEWKAFLSLQPQPVAWLRERIAEAISAATPSSADEDCTTSSRSH